MKKTMALIPALLMVAACAKEIPREPAKQETAKPVQASSLFNVKTMITLKEEIEQRNQQENLSAIRTLAEQTFKPILTSNADVWKDVKVLGVTTKRDVLDIEFEEISLLLKIKGSDITLTGPFRWNAGRTAKLKFTDTKIVNSKSKGEKLNEVSAEAISLCVTDDCKKIVTIVRLENDYRVVVTSKPSKKRNSLVQM